MTCEPQAKKLAEFRDLVRGSKDFRLTLAANILKKFHADITGVETYDRTTARSRHVERAAAGNGNPKAT